MYKKTEPIRNDWDWIPGGLLRKHPTGLCQETGIGDERASCVDCPQPCQGGFVCGAGGFINREIFLGTRSKFMATDCTTIAGLDRALTYRTNNLLRIMRIANGY